MNESEKSCCTPAAASASEAFHLSLNVSDLSRSVEFFSTLLGRAPAKHHADYAKFELESPPLVLSLQPGVVRGGGALNHLGFRVKDVGALVDTQRRLEMAGIATRREEGVACCYARQTKFWVEDPDANLWELYVLEEDLDDRDEARLLKFELPLSRGAPPSAESVWEHRLGQEFPLPLFVRDQTVDRVALDGTFNDDVADDEMLRRLSEVRRILKPAGRLDIHALVAASPLAAGPLNLPGPAAGVERVRQRSEIEELLAKSGFSLLECIHWGADPWFVVRETPLHEARFQGYA